MSFEDLEGDKKDKSFDRYMKVVSGQLIEQPRIEVEGG